MIVINKYNDLRGDNLQDWQKLDLILEHINDIRLEELEDMFKQWKDERIQG